MPSKLNSEWIRVVLVVIGAGGLGSGTVMMGGSWASDDHIRTVAREAASDAPAVVELRTDAKHIKAQVEKNCDEIQDVKREVQTVNENVIKLVERAGMRPARNDSP